MIKTAIFAGGCFWCMVKPFDHYEGVTSVLSGYTGGHTVNPTYEEVCSGTTGHVEAVKIEFEDTKISYDTLLSIFWRQIDPTDDGGQFVDRGSNYQSAIFYTNEEQRISAEKSKAELNSSGRFSMPIVTKIIPVMPFYPAEDYHQNFYQKNPAHFAANEVVSGREDFIKKHWSIEQKK